MSDDQNTTQVTLPTDVLGWVKVIRDCRAQIDELNACIEIARGVVEDALGDAEIGNDPKTGQPLVRWTRVTSQRVDTKKVKQLLTPDQLASVTSTSTSRRFTIEPA